VRLCEGVVQFLEEKAKLRGLTVKFMNLPLCACHGSTRQKL
jgi:hypothetical protein